MASNESPIAIAVQTTTADAFGPRIPGVSPAPRRVSVNRQSALAATPKITPSIGPYTGKRRRGDKRCITFAEKPSSETVKRARSSSSIISSFKGVMMSSHSPCRPANPPATPATWLCHESHESSPFPTASPGHTRLPRGLSPIATVH